MPVRGAAARDVGHAAHRLVLRLANGPLRPLARLTYRFALGTIAGTFRLVDHDATVYACGSLGRGDPVYGLSDFDLVVVTETDLDRRSSRRGRLRRHVDRLERIVPGPPRKVLEIGVGDEDDLHRTCAATLLTRDDAGCLSPADWSIVAELQERPGVARPLESWRRVAGRERRPPAAPCSRDRRRLDTWLELQHWWRNAFRLSLDPDGPATAYLAVKLVVEPVRAWLWLERALAPRSREDALVLALSELPEEEATVRRTLALERRPGRLPDAPTAEALRFLTRMTARVARSLERDAASAGTTGVRLLGGPSDLLLPDGSAPAGVLPLADWRAVATPRLPDEALDVRPGRLHDAEAIAAAARSERPGIVPALRADALLVLPTTAGAAEGMLRAVQCWVSDPASLALLAGSRLASFPELTGWSAADVAQRAVAEHAAWLRRAGPPPRHYLALPDVPDRVVALARLLTAVRAGLFADSLRSGVPTLAVAVAGAAACAATAELAERVRDAAAALAAWHREQRPPLLDPEPLRRLALELPAYATCVDGTAFRGNGRAAAAANRSR